MRERDVTQEVRGRCACMQYDIWHYLLILELIIRARADHRPNIVDAQILRVIIDAGRASIAKAPAVAKVLGRVDLERALRDEV